MHSLHEDPSQAEDLVPASVRAIDQVLNRRIRLAQTDGELDATLRAKQAIKRRLVAVPDAAVDTFARAVLGQLREAR